MPDLRSDTTTQPNAAMRDVMLSAPLGDDVYGEDPSVNALESYVAELLGKEAALFALSGTQSNLLALLSHCQRGDEYIVGQMAHTYRFEGGGAAVLGGIQPQPLDLDTHAQFDLDEVMAAIKPNDFHFARTRLLCLENTHNGIPLHTDYQNACRDLCDTQGLALHLDGARLFNACVATQVQPATLAAPYDSVSICLSKGLGAPVGSVLAGGQALVDAARRWRKMLGGGTRQAGMLAAAGHYALQHHREGLALDHEHAAMVTQALHERFGPDSADVATNMVHLRLPQEHYAALAQDLSSHGFTLGRPRWVFHRDIDAQSVTKLIERLHNFS